MTKEYFLRITIDGKENFTLLYNTDSFSSVELQNYFTKPPISAEIDDRDNDIFIIENPSNEAIIALLKGKFICLKDTINFEKKNYKENDRYDIGDSLVYRNTLRQILPFLGIDCLVIKVSDRLKNNAQLQKELIDHLNKERNIDKNKPINFIAFALPTTPKEMSFSQDGHAVPVLIDIKNKKIYCIDSQNNIGMEYAKEKINAITQMEEFKGFEIITNGRPLSQQKDDKNCVYFSITNTIGMLMDLNNISEIQITYKNSLLPIDTKELAKEQKQYQGINEGNTNIGKQKELFISMCQQQEKQIKIQTKEAMENKLLKSVIKETLLLLKLYLSNKIDFTKNKIDMQTSLGAMRALGFDKILESFNEKDRNTLITHIDQLINELENNSPKKITEDEILLHPTAGKSLANFLVDFENKNRTTNAFLPWLKAIKKQPPIDHFSNFYNLGDKGDFTKLYKWLRLTKYFVSTLPGSDPPYMPSKILADEKFLFIDLVDQLSKKIIPMPTKSVAVENAKDDNAYAYDVSVAKSSILFDKISKNFRYVEKFKPTSTNVLLTEENNDLKTEDIEQQILLLQTKIKEILDNCKKNNLLSEEDIQSISKGFTKRINNNTYGSSSHVYEEILNKNSDQTTRNANFQLCYSKLCALKKLVLADTKETLNNAEAMKQLNQLKHDVLINSLGKKAMKFCLAAVFNNLENAVLKLSATLSFNEEILRIKKQTLFRSIKKVYLHHINNMEEGCLIGIWIHIMLFFSECLKDRIELPDMKGFDTYSSSLISELKKLKMLNLKIYDKEVKTDKLHSMIWIILASLAKTDTEKPFDEKFIKLLDEMFEDATEKKFTPALIDGLSSSIHRSLSRIITGGLNTDSFEEMFEKLTKIGNDPLNIFVPIAFNTNWITEDDDNFKNISIKIGCIDAIKISLLLRFIASGKIDISPKQRKELFDFLDKVDSNTQNDYAKMLLFLFFREKGFDNNKNIAACQDAVKAIKAVKLLENQNCSDLEKYKACVPVATIKMALPQNLWINSNKKLIEKEKKEEDLTKDVMNLSLYN